MKEVLECEVEAVAYAYDDENKDDGAIGYQITAFHSIGKRLILFTKENIRPIVGEFIKVTIEVKD